MLLLFNKVDRPPAGAWRDDLHRAEPQSAFWHIGANTNATTTRDRLAPLGIVHLPLFIYPSDTHAHVWRSGLAPYAGTLDGGADRHARRPRRRATAASAMSSRRTACCSSSPAARRRAIRSRTSTSFTSSRSAPRTGTSSTSAWSCRRCATRAARRLRARCGRRATRSTARQVGRRSSQSARFDSRRARCATRTDRCRGIRGSASAARCGREQKLVPSRGQVLDHVAFSVEHFDALYAYASSRRREDVRSSRTHSAIRARS